MKPLKREELDTLTFPSRRQLLLKAGEKGRKEEEKKNYV